MNPARDDFDIYRVARLVIEQYGGSARDEAHGRAVFFHNLGDKKGHEVWARIANAIAELRSDKSLIH